MANGELLEKIDNWRMPLNNNIKYATRYELLEKYIIQRHEDLYQGTNIIDPEENNNNDNDNDDIEVNLNNSNLENSVVAPIETDDNDVFPELGEIEIEEVDNDMEMDNDMEVDNVEVDNMDEDDDENFSEEEINELHEVITSSLNNLNIRFVDLSDEMDSDTDDDMEVDNVEVDNMDEDENMDCPEMPEMPDIFGLNLNDN